MPNPSTTSTHSRVALVTGASSGIGRASALALYSAGFIVYATARSADSLQGLADLGVRTLLLDVTDDASMVRALTDIEADGPPVGVLVNNAGYGLNGPIEELDLPEVRREFETNVFGLLRLCQLVLPGMRRAGWGRIINIGSVGGSFTAPGAGAYHASKYALEAINDALRCEVQNFGVDVTLIKPTGVYTDFDRKIAGTMPDTGPDSPYLAFKANHVRVTQAMFTPGRNAAGIIRPEQVAAVVVQAALARRPRTRSVVGLSGHLYLTLRRLLPDRAWDRLMATQFPVSSASE